MKRFFPVLATVVLAASGCRTVTPEVASSIQVLHRNTHSLAAEYTAVLDRVGPPPGPEGETPEQAELREATWEEHVDHQRALMQGNNKLADKVLEWARIEAQIEAASDAGNGD